MIESSAKIKRKHLIKSQVPAFVTNEHQVFLAFLEAYYQFLSEKQFVVSEKFIDYLDVDSVPEDFLNYFWEEIKEIPSNVVVDKRLLAKHIRDLYASKGTRKSFDLLFRILFNEDIEIYEPKEDLLKVSDGKWVTEEIVRTKIPVGFDLTTLNGKKLYQYDDSNLQVCEFIVADVSLIYTDHEYLYVEITPNTLSGDVNLSYPLFTGDKSTRLEIVPTFDITGYPERGSLYQSGDIFLAGEYACYVEHVGSGPIDGVLIIDGGSGYTIGQELTIDESVSGGSGMSVIVSDVTSTGMVTALSIYDYGRGYEIPPTILGNGTGTFIAYSSKIGRVLTASVKEAISDSVKINPSTRAIVKDSSSFIVGEDLYQVSNVLMDMNGMPILDEVNNETIVDELVDGSEKFLGTVYKIESENVMVINNNYGIEVLEDENGDSILDEENSEISPEEDSFALQACQIQGSVSNTITEILYVNPCRISGSLQSIYNRTSHYLNEDGFISQFNKRIQDSYFYQDFSYVIKSSQSFEVYKNALKKLVHPAGFAVFGQVDINSWVEMINGSVRQSFEELRIVTDYVFAMKIKMAEVCMQLKLDSHVVLGPTYDNLDHFKLIFGNDYTDSITYGTDSLQVPAGKEFYRTAFDAGDYTWLVGNTPATAFATLTLEDIYDYPDGFSTEQPLILNGSWTLNGDENLDGIKEISIVSGYKFKKNKKFKWCFDADIIVSPSFPMEDEVIISDDVSFTLYSTINEDILNTDGITFSIAAQFSTTDAITSSDSATYSLTFNRTDSESINSVEDQYYAANSYDVNTITITETITNLDLTSPVESSTASEDTSWILSSSAPINTFSLNSGTI